MTLPLVSVVVPTYRRAPLLVRCLQALLAQRLDPHRYEIIVVDDGQEETVRRAVTLLQRRAGPTLRYLRPRQGRGPAVARNTGWQAARAPLVAFTDDDTVPLPDWLVEGCAAMAAHPAWSAACGAVRVPLPQGDGLRPTDHERMTQGLESAQFVTANAFVRREALVAVGGFDERFRRAWREDTDLQFRLQSQVGIVGRALAAIVQHPVRAERWGVSLRQQRNTFFDALLYKKHPVLYRMHIRPVPPWDYYAIVLLSLAALPLALAGAAAGAAGALLLAAVLVLRLAALRLRHTRRSARHVLEMLCTSALIPFLSVFWRLAGAWHFRVLFL